MKVLHVYRTYFPDPPGGLQEAIRQICLSTKALGVENTVFTLSPNPQPRMISLPEAEVFRCRSWAAPASCDLGGADAIETFRYLAKEVDIIHYLFPWPFGDILHEFAPRKPSVLTYISDIVRQKWLGALYAPLMWRTLSSMDAIVSNAPGYAMSSPVLQDRAIQDRIRQIPLGINEITDVEGDDGILERIGVGKGEPFILFLGALRYYKGLHILLEAAQKIHGKILIAGSGSEAPALNEQAKRLKLGNVFFCGQVKEAEKIALLKACRALVLPSHLRSEAYGMVLVEASMFSKPMVSCEIGTGTSFINRNLETGFVVEPENSQEMASAINRLLADHELAMRLGLAARRRYEVHFSGAALGRGYLQLYNDLIMR